LLVIAVSIADGQVFCFNLGVFEGRWQMWDGKLIRK
jgi:hypothetical protein